MNEYRDKLIKLYLKTESDIINEIARLRSLGFADYHVVAALKRVRQILNSMRTEAWEWSPKAIEYEFYAYHPEARTMPTTATAALRAYMAAGALTGVQHQVVDRLIISLMAELDEATDTAYQSLADYIVGRDKPDVWREIGLTHATKVRAAGTGSRRNINSFVADLQREGLTAFVDKAGRRWRLHTYASMVTRTTIRQAEVLAVLTQDPDHDLYTIKGASDPCGLCAPYQNRVYSKSGKDPKFPPLADAFGKVDKNGPNELTNTWLNIHPNCRCVIIPWTAAGRSREEIEKIERFSSPVQNPYTVDPRSKKAIEAYRKKEAGRRHWLERYREWEDMRIAIPDIVPKTFQTFERHKLADDAVYHKWLDAYKEA